MPLKKALVQHSEEEIEHYLMLFYEVVDFLQNVGVLIAIPEDSKPMRMLTPDKFRMIFKLLSAFLLMIF